MTLRLAKTTGGQNGAPHHCASCGGEHFVRSRIAFNCLACGWYIPINFNAPNATEKLKRDLEVLTEIHREFKKAVDDLERIVKD